MKTSQRISTPPSKRTTQPPLAAALGDVARAKGMTAIARETGLGRESLYKALSSNGNPEFGTVQKVVRSLGLKLHFTP